MDEYPLVTSVSEMVQYIDDMKEDDEFSDDLYGKILLMLFGFYVISSLFSFFTS